MEKSIISAAIKGDVIAFKKIFDFYVPKMRPVCLGYAHTTFEADDILQEAFVKIFHNLKNFKSEGSFEGWIRKIVVNTALNQYKKNVHLLKVSGIEDIGDNYSEEEDVTSELDNVDSSELMKLIHQLPPGYKMVFNLYVFEDLSHKEIGQMLGISEGTSRSQYSKSKKMIKTLISRQRNGENGALISRLRNNEE